MGPVIREIRFVPSAEEQLEQIHKYIARDSLVHADRMLIRIGDAIEQLLKYPYMGRTSRKAGTRDLVIARSPYLVTYRVDEPVIYVLAIYHGAQMPPRLD